MSNPTSFWCPLTLLVEIRTENQSTVRSMDRPFAIVGSDAGADIQVRDAGVPKRKLYLHATENGVFCIDLAPAVEPRGSIGGWLDPGEWLTVGNVRITARIAESPANTSATRRRQNLTKRCRDGLERPTVQVERDGQVRATKTINRPLSLIGRGSPSSIRIESMEVSSVHCALYWSGPDVWVIDLLSSHGTRWRGQAQESGRLEVGEAVQVGNYLLRRVTTASISEGEPNVLPPSPPEIMESKSDDLSSKSNSPTIELETATDGASPDVALPLASPLASPVAPASTPESASPLDEPALLEPIRARLESESQVLDELRVQLKASLRESELAREKWQAEAKILSSAREELELQTSQTKILRRRYEQQIARNQLIRERLERQLLENQKLQEQLQHDLQEAVAVRMKCEVRSEELGVARQTLEEQIASAVAARSQWEQQLQSTSRPSLTSTHDPFESETELSPVALFLGGDFLTPPASHASELATPPSTAGNVAAMPESPEETKAPTPELNEAVHPFRPLSSEIDRHLAEAFNHRNASRQDGDLHGAPASSGAPDSTAHPETAVAISSERFRASSTHADSPTAIVMPSRRIDEQAQRVTNQLIRHTSAQRRRQIIWTTFGVMLVATAALAVVAIAMHRYDAWPIRW